MSIELQLRPISSTFALKIFSFSPGVPTTIELDGYADDTPLPASDNAIFPSVALAIDQAYFDFTGTSLTLRSFDEPSSNVRVNDQLLRARIHTIQDGDVLEFGQYRRLERHFKVDCAARVSLSRIPSVIPLHAPENAYTAWPDVVLHHLNRPSSLPPSAMSIPSDTSSFSALSLPESKPSASRLLPCPTLLDGSSKLVKGQLPVSRNDTIPQLDLPLAVARVWNPTEEDSESYCSEKVQMLREAFGTDRSAAALVRDVFGGLPGTFRAMLRVWPSESSLDHLYTEMREWEPIWRQVFPHYRCRTSSVSTPHPVISMQTAVSSPDSATEETDDAGPALPPDAAVLAHSETTCGDEKTVALRATPPKSISVSASVLTSSSADALSTAASTSTTSDPTSTSFGSTAVFSAPSSATAQTPATSSCGPWDVQD